MKALLIALAATAACSPAFARLGETREECDKRYGRGHSDATSDGTPCIEFKKGELGIRIQFKDDKAVWIEYSKIEGYTDRRFHSWANPGRFDDAEQEVLLKANGGKRKWFGMRTEDGEIYARCTDRNRLQIWTREFTAKQLDGF